MQSIRWSFSTSHTKPRWPTNFVMLKIYEAENQFDAQLVLDKLLSADLEAVMKGQFLSGAIGELPTAGLITVWLVHPDDESKGQIIVEEFESHKRHTNPPQKCPGCSEIIEGNFLLCWNCGDELPEIAKSF